MPKSGRLSDSHDTHYINSKGPTVHHQYSDRSIHQPTHVGHAQPRLRQPRRIPATNVFAALVPNDFSGRPLGLSLKRRDAIRSLPTPDSSPERPSYANKTSKKQTVNNDSLVSTPPHSEEENNISSEVPAREFVHSLDFPIDRRPLPTTCPSKNAKSWGKDQSPSRRIVGAGNRRLGPKPSTDRFISTRASAYDLSQAFRASKPTQDLTRSEKLLRDSSASPDPFGRLVLPRLSEQRVSTIRGSGGLVQTSQDRSRTTSTFHTIALHQDLSAPQNRQVSAGAVWNVGGVAQTDQPGPVRAIPNGRGGFLSSGSNAPMYTAEFLDQHSTHQETETLENRVARALDIDRTERLININRSTRETRCVSTGSVGLTKWRCQDGPKTEWVNGEWVRSCSLCECEQFRNRGWCLWGFLKFVKAPSEKWLTYSSAVARKVPQKATSRAVPVTPFR